MGHVPSKDGDSRRLIATEPAIRLEEWRSANPPRTRLPEPIWEAAVEMAQRHGLHRTTMAARIPADWEALYAHSIYLLETFVDPERFRGTCYLAANWKVPGETTGRGKADLTHRPNRSIKQVLVLPLHRRFRELLSMSTR